MLAFEYPGNLTSDSFGHLIQIETGKYTNHQPYYYTIIIKACLSFGMMIFGNLDAAIATYSITQIVFMAACFTYCIATLYQMNIPKLCLCLTFCFYAVIPYHISYSFTMWKDVSFGGAVLLMIVSLYRLLNDIGKIRTLDYVILVIGAFGTCLLRNNGWIAFAISLIIFAIYFYKKHKIILMLLSTVLVFTYIMTHPVLSYLEVAKIDTVESLSVPIQQIAYVVSNMGDVSQTEYNKLDKIVDTNKIKTTYNPYVSDPIKQLVREKGNMEILNNNKIEYFNLWISIGLKNPSKYVIAWINQTKGYWNGGYDYWIWNNAIKDNWLDLQKTSVISIEWLYDLEFKFFENFFIKRCFFDI